MITPILERLLLTGRATKRNFTHALSGAGRIPCPKDRWLIITDIFAYPVTMAERDVDFPKSGNIIAQYAALATFQLFMYSKAHAERYIFKNTLGEQFADSGGTPYMSNSPMEHRDVFDIHTSDIVLTLSRSPDLGNAPTVDFTPPTAAAQQQFPPNGYGISRSVINRIVQVDNSEYTPQGADTLFGFTPTTRNRSDFSFDNVAGQTEIFPLSGIPHTNDNCPIISFNVISVHSKDLQNL